MRLPSCGIITADSFVDGAAGWWGWMTISTRLCTAAGACLLTSGLVIGSAFGAIASADADSDGSDTSSQSADGPTGSAAGPSDNAADSPPEAVQRTAEGVAKTVSSTLSSFAKLGEQQSSTEAPPRKRFGSTRTAGGSTDLSGSTQADAIPPTSESAIVTPPRAVVASVPARTVPASDVVVTASNAIAAVANSVASAPALVAAIPHSATPVSDVITTVQGVLTSITDAGAQFTQVVPDLADLLGVAAMAPTTTGAGTEQVGPSAAVDTPMPAPETGALQRPSPFWFEEVLATDEFADPVTLLDVTTAGTSRGITTPSTALPTPEGDGSSVLSIVKQVVGVIVASVSLAALLAMALPGIGGLLGACAAGTRIGYRQAKAGSVLQTTAIARFAGSGPIGVVRSGSQISLGTRVARPDSRDAVHARAVRPGASPLQPVDQAV